MSVYQIPGVAVEVYHEKDLVAPEADGYVGDLASGSVTILAEVADDADWTVAFFRTGDDNFLPQKDWNRDPDDIPQLNEEGYEEAHAKQKRRFDFLSSRDKDSEGVVFGSRFGLDLFAYDGPLLNKTSYPANTLCLGQYVRLAGRLTGHVHVWEVAVISQGRQFFLTVQRRQDLLACSGYKGRLCFPGVGKHKHLGTVLVNLAPEGLPLIPAPDTLFPPEPSIDGLRRNEGMVESWHDARNMGKIVTAQGWARVHWTEAPPSPRLRYLGQGQRVRFSNLAKAQRNPKTEYRPGRKPKYTLDAFGVEPVS
ncbi:hypothetical protein KW786_00050 [Candidatus Parcubacteria bacterium]|nr:hypothetical protein [Candidatus Parcubacteria bacterium]